MASGNTTSTDYFAFLGVPRKLRLDAADLERRFRTLSRQYHPDFFYNATPAERRVSLERTSYLNDAYRALKHPIGRIAYLLELEGFSTTKSAGQTTPAVPPSLLEEVFALNEELDTVRELRESGAPETEWKERLLRARAPIDAKRAEHEQDLESLSAEWDALPDSADRQERVRVLTALRDRMLERNYINNLIDSIERELAGAQAGARSQEPGV